jgi:RHS repeat-associated protein
MLLKTDSSLFVNYHFYDSRKNRRDVKTFLYGQNDYIEPPIPNFYQENTGMLDCVMKYNGNNDYNDIYELDLGENPSLSFGYLDAIIYKQINGMVTSQTYSNLNINQEGYYTRRYSATNWGSYSINFTIVFKVGNPRGDDRVPEKHIHYNYSTNWKDQLIGYGEIEYINGVPQTEATVQHYTYDAQGNPITITNFVYDKTTYDSANLSWSGRELTNIIINQNSSIPLYEIRYYYNDQSYRTKKEFYTYNGSSYTLNETIEYELIDDKVVYETNGIYSIIYTYDYDGTLISFSYDDDIDDLSVGTEYFYIYNQMGDITHIIDINGEEKVRYIYDAYGNIIDIDAISPYSEIAEANPYRYRGYRYDSEINMYYLNSRYYNPEIGRFINADGLLGELGNIQSTNMYAYCANNPLLYIDEDGEFWHLIGGFVVGAAIGGVTQIAMNIITGNKWNDDLSGAVIGGGVAGLLTASGAGFLSMSIYTGLATSTGNQLQDNGFNPNDWNMAEFATEVFITGLLAGVGSAYGSKQIGASAKQVKNWFKPKYFSTMVSGKFMKKITKAVAYSSISTVIYSLKKFKIENRIEQAFLKIGLDGRISYD